jgi:hypothetical protein
MAASRLSIYQAAAQIIGERRPVSLTENVPVRKELDGVWERGGVKTCLQQYLWNFATRSVELTYSPSVTPAFSFRYAFEKPDDFVRVAQLAVDEYYRHPLTEFQDDGNYWFADIDTIYVRYVSNDDSYGHDYSKWPENFTRFVEHYFAHAICDRITGSGGRVGGVGDKKTDIARDMRFWRDQARQTDAAEEPTTRAPQGAWVTARTGNFTDRYRTRR